MYAAKLAGLAWCTMVLCLCTRTVVDMASETESGVLFAASEGWPEDTSGGLCATGTARVTEGATANQRTSRAEYSALLRVQGTLRGAYELPPEQTDARFFSCVEENASNVHVKRETLENGTVRIDVFIGKDGIGSIVDCIKRK